jgi:NAD(P)-dependent dehydrogenase (short-subunit alcohol dehydrogenase family)
MYDDLKGKIALVTGSGKKTGIGFGIARALAASGASIVISDLGTPPADDGQVKTGTTDEMTEVAAELSDRYGVEAISVPADVTDNHSIREMGDVIRERFGRLDILCNNAGATFGVPNTVQNYDEDCWMRTIDVNLHSVFKVSRGVLPLMVGNGGTIINTASRAGKVPPLFNGAYAVAKAGVIMLTKVMAVELAGNGIRVNAICPGQIMTDLERWRFGLEAQLLNSTVEAREAEMCKTIPLNRIGTIAEVGSLAAFLASEASSYMTGQAVNITGGQLMEL